MIPLDTVQCGQCGARWRAKDLADGGHDCGIQPQAITPDAIAAIVNERDSLRREVGKLTRSKDYAARLHKTEIERLTAAFEKSQAITPESIAAIVNERDRLRNRVVELLVANNREVEARRSYAAQAIEMAGIANQRAADLADMTAAFEKSQDDLATARAERDEALRERDSARAVADLIARNSMSARPAGAKPEYVFGPWVKVKPGDPCPRNTWWQRRYSDGSVIGPDHRHTGSFYADMEVRRAWRIGEWHDHDGSPCPIESGAHVEIEARGSGAIFRHIAHNGERWNGVKRFRPIGATS